MKKILYIIPGWEDTCELENYLSLAKVAKNKGFEVVCINIDWKEALSGQIFEVAENSIIFGFSLGAIFAWLVAQKYPCEHLILASMTPHYSFTDPEIKTALIDLCGASFVDDICKNITPSNMAKKQTIVYGDKEGEPADILVKNTDHELNENYIKAIEQLL